ncbi:MAG: bifunctional oligoribonuclease/PAP phosphatase NrnA [Desulfobacterales bacterium]|nr:bifunctional oligoribonuclease/PAP phosphatase NrnA [Desulfobacterales bacterium]
MDIVKELILASNNILLTTHTQLDGDAIGSLISLGLSILSLKKKAVLLAENPIPAIYRFLPKIEIISNSINDRINDFDAVIVLDCGDLERIGENIADITKIPVIINIDHHITNSKFGQINLIDVNASSTCEVVYKLIKFLGIKIDIDMAFAIYTGILTDTGSFRFSNTNCKAFEICQEMLNIGVDPHRVAQNIYGTYSLNSIKLLNRVLDSIEVSKNGKLSLMFLTKDMLKETQTKFEDVHGVINYAKYIEDVKVAVLIHENETNSVNKCGNEGKSLFHVSLRSNGSVDVSSIALKFGGGGHFDAAGFTICSSLFELKDQILKLSENF